MSGTERGPSQPASTHDAARRVGDDPGGREAHDRTGLGADDLGTRAGRRAADHSGSDGSAPAPGWNHADRPEEAVDATASTGRRISRPGRAAADRDRGRGSFLRELPILILIAFLLALLIKTLLVQAFWIPSESMERTLLIDDRVLVNKVVYRFRDVHRGEVVVFNGQGTGFEQEAVVAPADNPFSRFFRGTQNLLGLGAPSEEDFIKRVIGIGGDTVACCDAEGRVTVNGASLDEPYVYENDFRRFGPVTVPEGELWLMGDHRSHSSDSRQNGTVPEDKVVGRAFVRVWPMSRTGLLGVPDTFGAIPAARPAGSSGSTEPTGPPPAATSAGGLDPEAVPAFSSRGSS